MTNQAIIYINPDKNKDLLFKKLNDKIFLHYQLSYLAENLFRKIIIIEPDEAPPLKSFLGNSYIDMKIQYLSISKDLNESKAILKALEMVEDVCVFVFDAHHFFRLNLSKADDFRRMRMTKMLHIGKKAEDFVSDNLWHLSLGEKGNVKDISIATSEQDLDTFFTGTWLINKIYFQKEYSSSNSNLFEILKSNYQNHQEFCLACRQYFVEISSEKDLEKAENDIKEYHYQ